jgi:hypothetical protein
VGEFAPSTRMINKLGKLNFLFLSWILKGKAHLLFKKRLGGLFGPSSILLLYCQI